MNFNNQNLTVNTFFLSTMSDKSDRHLYHKYETLNMSKNSGGGHSPPISRATSPLNHDYEPGTDICHLNFFSTAIAQLIKTSEYVCTGRDPVQASALFLNELNLSHTIYIYKLKFIIAFIHRTIPKF